MRKVNFSAGPSILPQEVFQQASQAVINFEGTGLSLLEISHRDKAFVQVYEEAVSLVKELLAMPSDFEVLFLSGGASSQFFMVPMNLLQDGEKAAYINTGTWSTKAIDEAQLFGKIEVVASSKTSNFNHIPKQYEVPSDCRYLHYTSNNTIYGTQFQTEPNANIPLVCDMSSDIFSRPIDFSKYDLIYAGAQKNLGPAGVTLVLVRKSILDRQSKKLSSMLDYRVHIANESMYNTPPVFPIYVSMLTLRWLKAMGGISAIQLRNEAKAKLLYDEIDRNSLFQGHAVPEDRSKMNVTFTIKDSSLEKDFLAMCEENGCEGLKGHRSVGGFRASIYNAMDLSGVERLVSIMKQFENEKK